MINPGTHLTQAEPITFLQPWEKLVNDSEREEGLMTPDKVGPEPALVPVYLEADSPPPLPSLLPDSSLLPLLLLLLLLLILLLVLIRGLRIIPVYFL